MLSSVLFEAITRDLPVAGLLGQSHGLSSLSLALKRSVVVEELVITVWRAGKRFCKPSLNQFA
jgi:hypothetical protein